MNSITVLVGNLLLVTFAKLSTEHTEINRTVRAPKYSKLWDPIIPKIGCTKNPRPASTSIPKK